MKCPKCGSATNVIDSVFNKDENQYYRTRSCKECKKRFHTIENFSDESADFLDKFYKYRRRGTKK